MSGIAEEIRKALEAATPDWYDNGNEIVSKGNPRVGIGGFLKDEDNHLAANAPEWLRYLLQQIEQQQAEIERLQSVEHTLCLTIGEADKAIRQSREENERLKNEIKSHGPEGRNYTNAQYVELRIENERLRGELAEKDKVLKWYADEDTHEIKRRVLGDFAPISLDKGQRARDILAKYTTTERGDSLDDEQEGAG